MAAAIVNRRSRRGVSQPHWRVWSHARRPVTLAAAVNAQVAHTR